jgi:WD40 repeat protein
MVSFPWRMMRKWPCAGLIFFAWSLPLFGQKFDGTLRGHEGAILMGVFTPDGQRAVTASADQTARVWDVKTGQMLRRYDQHTGPLYSLAVSQSGHTLVTGSQDNTVRTWDLPSTTPDESLVSAAAAVRGIALHPDGNGLLAVSADKLLSIHNLRTSPLTRGEVAKPQPPEIRTGHSSELLTVGIRSDGVAYASADVEGHIHLWNAFLPAPQRTLLGAASRVSAVRFTANNQQLISSGDDGVIRVWQLNTPAPRVLPALTAEVVALDLLTNQPTAVVALADKTVRVINLTDDSVVAQFPPLPFSIRGVTHAPSNAWIGVAGDQGQAAVVNSATGAIQGVVLGHAGEVTAIAAHADNMQFVTTGIDGTIRLWQQPLPEIVAAGHTGPVRGIAAAPGGQWYATISDDKTTRIWDANGTAVRQLGSHEQPLRAIAVRDDAALLATGDAGGDVWLWNPADGSPQGIVAAHPGGITGMTFSADRTLLITTGADQKIRAWKLPLPPKKPGEGETPLAPTWESVIPGGRTVSTILTLPGDLGYAGLQVGVGEVLRLKIDGSDFSPRPTSPRPLKSLQLSNDGQQLLGVDDQGQAFLWNGQGTILKTFPLGPNVTSARFRPDGRELVVLDAQPRLRICDASTGLVNEELTTSAPLTDAVWMANESRHLAGAGPGNSVIVSRRALQRIFAEVTDPASPPLALKPVTSVAMVADQQHLLAARKEGGLEQWRMSDGVLVRKFDANSAEIHELSISTNGQLVAGIGADQKLRIWTWGDGRLSQTIDLPASGRSLTISPDNSRVATGHSDGKLRVWDLVTGRLLETIEGHAAGAAVARFLGDSRTLVSGSADKTVRVSPCAATHGFQVASEAVPPIALYNGGTHALTGRSTGEVVMVDLNSGMESRIFRVKTPQPPVAATGAPPAAPGPYALFQPTTLASRSDNQRVAAGTRTGEVYLWNANNGEDLLAKFPLGAAVSTLAFSPDNQKLAATTVDGKVRIYGPSIPGVQPALEWMQWQEFQTATPVTDLAFTPDSRSVWVSLESGAVERWAISAPGPVRQFNHGGPVYGTAVSWDGQTIVSCSADQTVRVWDNKTGQQKYQLNGHEGPVHAVTMSLDETFAVSSGADGTLRLWDIAGGRQLKELARYDSTMYSVAIHPLGQLVAAAGADRRVHLLDLNAGAEVRTLEGHKDYLHSVQFSPDGAKLASFGYAGHLKIWRTADGALLHESRQGNVGNFAAFSPDGTRLLLSGGDGLARILVVP